MEGEKKKCLTKRLGLGLREHKLGKIKIHGAVSEPGEGVELKKRDLKHLALAPPTVAQEWTQPHLLGTPRWPKLESHIVSQLRRTLFADPLFYKQRSLFSHGLPTEADSYGCSAAPLAVAPS